jgi:hypothetical protein
MHTHLNRIGLFIVLSRSQSGPTRYDERARMSKLALSVLFASLLAACSGGTGSPGSGGAAASASASTTGAGSGGAGGSDVTGGAAPFVTAPHAALPQVVSYGGPVLYTPKVQVISYAADPDAADVDAFVQGLTTFLSSTWSVQTAEYGIGPLAVLPAITLPGTAPTMLDDHGTPTTPFQQNLASQLEGVDPAWGAADSSTIYLFLLPLGTDITSSAGHCCIDVYGYHSEVSVAAGGDAGAIDVPYAVVCTCPTGPGNPLSPLDRVTSTVIHELVESATDPFFYTRPAYAGTDEADLIWTLTAGGGEVGDLCQFQPDAHFEPDGKWMIQQTWSDVAAKAGKDPCVPASSTDPYFDSAPVLPDMLVFDGVHTKGVAIPLEETRTIDVQLFSEAPTGPWTVSVYNFYSNADLTLCLAANTGSSGDTCVDTLSGSNGDTLQLTITANAFESNTGGTAFVLESSFGGQSHLWFGAVGTP